VSTSQTIHGERLPCKTTPNCPGPVLVGRDGHRACVICNPSLYGPPCRTCGEPLGYRVCRCGRGGVMKEVAEVKRPKHGDELPCTTTKDCKGPVIYGHEYSACLTCQPTSFGPPCGICGNRLGRNFCRCLRGR
jgi:hypothetical protein